MNLRDALETAIYSDAGRVRTHNEDAVYANPHLGLAILADGMGGYNAGEVASRMVTTLLSSGVEDAFSKRKPQRQGGRREAHDVLEAQIASANTAVYQAAQSQAQYAGMGTTLVMALFYDDSMTVAHIGDSRLYRLRGDEFQQITHDHSLLQEQIDSGMLRQEEARHAKNRNLVTRALGVDATVEPEIRDYDTLAGDIYLLCSDGLNDMVEDSAISTAIELYSASLDLAATKLVQMANDNGGRDNVSVILVRIKRGTPAPWGWLTSLRDWFT